MQEIWVEFKYLQGAVDRTKTYVTCMFANVEDQDRQMRVSYKELAIRASCPRASFQLQVRVTLSCGLGT